MIRCGFRRRRSPTRDFVIANLCQEADRSSAQGRREFGIVERTFSLAVDILLACRALEARSWVSKTLGSQLLRAGTSIGANMEEAQAARSRRDLVSKSSISLKEARDSVRAAPLNASGLMPAAEADLFIQEAGEISLIIGAIEVSTKRKGN